MLSHVQFSQIKKMLQGSLREVECPCGVHFYTCSTRAVYHNNACRQHFFREKNREGFDNGKISDVEIVKINDDNNETINQLIEKEKIYANKLKSI